jgi:DNA polymerase III delta subunit
MLAVFYGTDRDKVNDAAAKRLKAFLKENKPAGRSLGAGGDAEVFALGDENFSESELERHIGSVGLFSGAHAVVISYLLAHEEHGEVLADHLASLAESENLFILKEGKLLVANKKIVEKYAQDSQEFTEKTTINKPDFKNFPIFDLATSLGMRDKKNLWLGYQKAIQQGVAPEEIHGVLVWQIRTMLQVLAGATVDIKPFVLGKAKTFLTKYSPSEAKDLSFKLISLYHDSRRGLVDFEKGLEKIILSL